MAPADHRAAYDALTERLMADLFNVESRDSARRFARDGAKLVRRQGKRVPEFYIAEFLDILRRTLVDRFSAETEALKQAVDDAQMEASVGTVELTARLEAASVVGDQDAQHDIWQEREELQRAVQQKIDNSAALAETFSTRLEAFEQLASELGVTFS